MLVGEKKQLTKEVSELQRRLDLEFKVAPLPTSCRSLILHTGTENVGF